MAFRVKRFDAQTIGESRIVFIIGKRNTGKSVLMKDLLHQMPRPDFVLAMAPTTDSLDMFREFLPECCIFDHFAQDRLDALVQVQKDLVARGKRRHVLVILDDCLYQKNVLKSTSMRHIFMNGRHDHISLMCAAQYLMDIEPALRNNIDYLFSMRESAQVNRRKLFQYYFGTFNRFDDFEKVFAACTNDYKAIVLDNTCSSTGVGDSVRWYRATMDVPPFKLCKPIHWKLTRRHAANAKPCGEPSVVIGQVPIAKVETVAD